MAEILPKDLRVDYKQRQIKCQEESIQEGSIIEDKDTIEVSFHLAQYLILLEAINS